MKTCNYYPNHRDHGQIAMDYIIGPPPSGRNGKEYVYSSILTIVDRYTKMALFTPVMDTMDAAKMAQVPYNELECRFRSPLWNCQ
jgi:hypothetical protein